MQTKRIFSTVYSSLLDQKVLVLSSSQPHLVSKSCQVSLKAFMFALQSLHAGQVMAIVVCV